jgi:Cu/Ag efflux protein CusF
MTKRVCLLLLALSLPGCAPKEPEKRYPVQAEIKAVDSTAKTATLDAGNVGDWMGPMTMEYPVKPDSELAKLHVGDHIQASVVVQGQKYYVTGIKVLPK